MQTHNKDKAQLMLKNCKDIDTSSTAHHTCDLCSRALSDEECLLLDDIQEYVSLIQQEEKLVLFYLGGYIASKHPSLCGDKTDPHFDEVKSYVDVLDRDGLHYPSAGLFELILLAFVFFTKSPNKLCRNRLVDLLLDFPGTFNIDITIEKPALVRLSNILFKRFAQLNKGISKGASKRKSDKLSSSSKH